MPVRLERPDPKRRRVGCINTNRCLAIAEDWPGMGCPSDCASFRQMTLAEDVREMDGLADLWFAAWRAWRLDEAIEASSGQACQDG
jgi:hypothetical protein